MLLFAVGCGKQGCTDKRAQNYEPGIKYDDGSCTYCACKDTNAENYNKNAFCEASDSCDYVTDEYVDRFEGWAVIIADTNTAAMDTIDSFYITISQEPYNPNLLRINENSVSLRMDTTCGFTSFGDSDSSYVISFEPKGAPNPTTTSCLDRFPLQFEFFLSGDSMTYKSRIIDNSSSGQGATREVLFSGNRAE